MDSRDYLTNDSLSPETGIGKIWVPTRPLVDTQTVDLNNIVVSDRQPVLLLEGKVSTLSTTSGTPALPIISCTATENPTKVQGKTLSLVSVSFVVNPADTNYDSVRIWFTGYHGNSNPQLMPADARVSPSNFTVETTGETVTVTVQAVSADGVPADFVLSPSTTVLLDGVISAPPTPSIIQTLAGTPSGYQFTFAQLAGLPADIVDSYRVYRNSVNNSSTATCMQTFRHDPTNGGNIIVQDVQPYLTLRYYWVSAVNTSGLESTKVAAQSTDVYSGSQLDANGNLVSADQIAADGITYLRDTATGSDIIILGNPNFELSSSIIPPPGWRNNGGGSTTLSYETGSPQSGNRSLKVVTSVQYGGASPTRQWKVNPGDTFYISGWAKSSGGKQALIQLAWMDKDAVYIDSIQPFTTSSSWTFLSGTGVVPAGTTQAKLSIGCWDVGGGTVWFDNFTIIRCTDPSTLELLKKGSVPPSFTPGVTYTSTTSSITVLWNFTGYRTDLFLTTFSANSSQLISGLSSSTAYNFYLYYDETIAGVGGVATGGVGSPSWAHTGTDRAWTAEQCRADHMPLSAGAPLSFSTSASGTGGGGGGGDGGCLKIGMQVKEQDRGVIKVEDLRVGDHIWSEHDTWLDVARVEIKPHDLWTDIEFNNGASVEVTSGHPWTLAEDRSMKRSSQLCMEDGIPCPTGVAFMSSIKFTNENSFKVTVECADPHVFYASKDGINWVLTHNNIAKTV